VIAPLEYSEAMLVTRRAKHQENSLMAATKASAARTHRTKRAELPKVSVQAVAPVDSSQSTPLSSTSEAVEPIDVIDSEAMPSAEDNTILACSSTRSIAAAAEALDAACVPFLIAPTNVVSPTAGADTFSTSSKASPATVADAIGAVGTGTVITTEGSSLTVVKGNKLLALGAVNLVIVTAKSIVGNIGSDINTTIEAPANAKSSFIAEGTFDTGFKGPIKLAKCCRRRVCYSNCQ